MTEIKIYLEKLDLNLSALVFGQWPTNKKVIIALHGWLDNANSFLPMAQYLTDYTVIAIDLPGHGKSDWLPKPQAYHFLDNVNFLYQIVNELGLKNCNLMGHSMGGAIGTLFAASFPSFVNKLVLIDILGPLSNKEDQTSERIHAYVEQFHDHFSKKTTYYPSVDDAVKVRSKLTEISVISASVLAERGLLKNENGYKWSSDPKLKIPSMYRFTENQIEELIRDIKCEVLYFHAIENKIFRNQLNDTRIKHYANIEKIDLDGLHHVHMDLPGQTAKYVKDFLEN